MGDMGNGKSILAKKITLDWAEYQPRMSKETDEQNTKSLHRQHSRLNEIANSEAEFVKDFDLLIFIELGKVGSGFGLAKVIGDQINLKSNKTAEIVRWIKKNQEKCLLILDGLDEYNEEMSKDITNILKRTYLENVHLLVTSRIIQNLQNSLFDPSQRKKMKISSIQGFDKKQAEDYIKKVFAVTDQGTGADEVQKFNSKLSTRKLRKLMRSPIMSTYLCLLFINGTLHKHLNTVTKIYKEILYMILFTGDKRQNEFEKLVMCLGKHAFDAIIRRRNVLVYPRTDQGAINWAVSKGLISEMSTQTRQMKYFEHQSLQEFLAAIYVVHTKNKCSELRQFLSSLNLVCNYCYLIGFICGLRLHSGTKMLIHICQLANEDTPVQMYPRLEYSVSWDRHDMDIDEIALKKLCEGPDAAMLILDFLSEIVMQKSTHDGLDQRSIKQKSRMFPYVKPGQKDIPIALSLPPILDFSVLSLSKMNSLIACKEVTLQFTGLQLVINNLIHHQDTEKCFDNIFHNVDLKKVKHLFMGRIMPEKECRLGLSKHLKNIPALLQIKAENVGQKVQDRKDILGALAKKTTLKQMHFEQFDLSDCGEEFVKCSQKSKLEELVIREMNWTEKIDDFFSSIQKQEKLVKLEISHSDLSKSSHDALSKTTSGLNLLQNLVLRNTAMTKEQLQKLYPTCHRLRTLNISSNENIASSVEALVKELPKMQNLLDLSLAEGNLGNEAAQAVMDKLPKNLEVLDISKNSIDELSLPDNQNLKVILMYDLKIKDEFDLKYAAIILIHDKKDAAKYVVELAEIFQRINK